VSLAFVLEYLIHGDENAGFFHIAKFVVDGSAKDAQIQPPSQHFYTTGDAKQFAQFVTAWLEQAEPSIGQCQIEGDEILEVSHRNAE